MESIFFPLGQMDWVAIIITTHIIMLHFILTLYTERNTFRRKNIGLMQDVELTHRALAMEQKMSDKSRREYDELLGERDKEIALLRESMGISVH